MSKNTHCPNATEHCGLVSEEQNLHDSVNFWKAFQFLEPFFFWFCFVFAFFRPTKETNDTKMLEGLQPNPGSREQRTMSTHPGQSTQHGGSARGSQRDTRSAGSIRPKLSAGTQPWRWSHIN